MLMRTLVADDHPLFRDAISAMIRRALVGTELVTCENFSQAEQALEDDADFDLALIDLHMPDGDGYYGLIHLRSAFPAVPVVIVSGSDDPKVVRKCLNFGASGFIPKSLDTDSMVAAVHAILEGEIWLPNNLRDEIAEIDRQEKDFAAKVATLTQQQYRVLCELNEGRLNKQIAYDLDISEATVKAHVTAIFKKLGVINRTQAVIAAQKLKLMSNFNPHST